MRLPIFVLSPLLSPHTSSLFSLSLYSSLFLSLYSSLSAFIFLQGWWSLVFSQNITPVPSALRAPNRRPCEVHQHGRSGISLMVQWLGLHASTIGGLGSIPGWELRSHMLCLETHPLQKKKKGRRKLVILNVFILLPFFPQISPPYPITQCLLHFPSPSSLPPIGRYSF